MELFDRSISYKETARLVSQAVNDINTLFPAIVEEYNVETGLITVLPKTQFINNDGEYQDRAFLFECPTSYIKAQSFYLRIPYQKGDIVYVGCSQDSLDSLLTDANTVANPLDGVRKFRLTDAVVIGGLMTTNEAKMTTEYPRDFIIQNRVNNDIIVLKEEGGVQVKTTTTFQIDATDVVINSSTMTMNVDSTTTNGSTIAQNVSTTTNSGNVTVDGALKAGTVDTIGGGISLDGHTHSYTAPAHAAGSANTSPSQ